MPTYTTLLPDNIYPFLSAQDGLYREIERDMHVRVMRGEKISKVEKLLQAKYGVDSTTVRNVWHDLKGKHAAVRELQELRVKELKQSIASINRWIKKTEKKVIKLRKKGKPFKRHLFAIHQKKRRLAIKEGKLSKLKAKMDSGYISLAFGSKKLFNAQHHLEANGYANHEEWLKDWRDARSGNFMMVGSRTYAGGNQLCRLSAEGELKITVPPCLVARFGSKVTAEGVHFRYGQGWINAALEPVRRFSKGKRKTSRIGTEKSVTHRFVRKNDKWYLHTTVELPETPRISSKRNGALGIDLNAKSIEWAHCDKEGNLKAQGKIALDLTGKSSLQSTDIISNAVGELMVLATTFQCPIVIEKLDFSDKKAGLREQGKGYATMLSQFAYSKFGQFVESKGYRAGIQIVQVNPAYSSLIGLTKYMSMYGLSSGTAAALVLARRCFRFSERLPKPVMAFLSPVDETKHLWSSWRRLSRALKGAYRHSFYAMGVRVGVNLDRWQPSQVVRRSRKLKSTPVIPSERGALSSRTEPKFNQLCLSF